MYLSVEPAEKILNSHWKQELILVSISLLRQETKEF